MTFRRASFWIILVPVLIVVSIPACGLLRSWFGPPAVTSTEEYGDDRGTARFDHSQLDAVLRKHVDADGWVDYEALSKDPRALDSYIATLAKAPYDALSRDGKLTLLINAYNACTLRLIVDHWPTESIRDIPAAKRWKDERWQVGPMRLSLDAIEHEYLRKRFKEPRIHFAVNCASVGCPPLLNEAYVEARLEAQLQQQSETIHRNGSRWFRLDGNRLALTKLYDWFAGDFVQSAGSVLAFASRFSPELAKQRTTGQPTSIEWIDYSWVINSKANAK